MQAVAHHHHPLRIQRHVIGKSQQRLRLGFRAIAAVEPGNEMEMLRDPGLGVAALELNQGDTKSGRINRSDVAAICIESLDSAAAFDTTFECYNADSAKGLDEVMGSNAKAVSLGEKTEVTKALTGLERRADTWPKLFEGLQRDPLV